MWCGRVRRDHAFCHHPADRGRQRTQVIVEVVVVVVVEVVGVVMWLLLLLVVIMVVAVLPLLLVVLVVVVVNQSGVEQGSDPTSLGADPAAAARGAHG